LGLIISSGTGRISVKQVIDYGHMVSCERETATSFLVVTDLGKEKWNVKNIYKWLEKMPIHLITMNL